MAKINYRNLFYWTRISLGKFSREMDTALSLSPGTWKAIEEEEEAERGEGLDTATIRKVFEMVGVPSHRYARRLISRYRKIFESSEAVSRRTKI